jgi:hypothetical protein
VRTLEQTSLARVLSAEKFISGLLELPAGYDLVLPGCPPVMQAVIETMIARSSAFRPTEWHRWSLLTKRKEPSKRTVLL